MRKVPSLHLIIAGLIWPAIAYLLVISSSMDWAFQLTTVRDYLMPFESLTYPIAFLISFVVIVVSFFFGEKFQAFTSYGIIGALAIPTFVLLGYLIDDMQSLGIYSAPFLIINIGLIVFIAVKRYRVTKLDAVVL